MAKIKKIQKKNNSSKKDELYLDIYLPCGETDEDNQEEKNSKYVIPIRKEKFALNPGYRKTVEQAEEYEEEEEFEEEYEEEIVEEPIKKPSKKRGGFRLFKRKTKKEKPTKPVRLKKEKIKVKEYKPRANKTGFKKKILIAFFAIFILLISAALVASFVFNKATINIVSQKSSVDYSTKILIDAKAETSDLENNMLKGRELFVEASSSKEFEATGKVTGGAKARGKLIIYNAYNTSPQILVQNTRFESPDGLIFRLDNRTTIPGGTIKNGELSKGSIEVSVTADEIGEGYNIDKVRFTIPGFAGSDRFYGFYAESVEKFSGGSSGESVVVSETDLQNASKEISDLLMQELDRKIEAEMGSDEKTFKDTITKKINSPVYNVRVGDSQEKFTVEISGEVKAMAFSRSEYQNILKNSVSEIIDHDEELYDEPQEVINSVKLLDKDNQVEVSLSLSYPTKKKISANEIFNNIKGKNIEEVRTILLSTSGIERVNIKLWPFWINTVPDNYQKIYLGID